MTVTFAFSRVSSFALAPTIQDPGDVIIGDLEQGAANNVFVFPDAIDLDSIVSDEGPSSAIKWSWISSLGGASHLLVNNVPQLTSGPDNPNPVERVDQHDNDIALQPGSQDGSARTITFRNNSLSDITIGGGLGPYAEPATTGVLPLETEMITLFASDCTTYSSVSITVYTANNTSDSISGGSALVPVLDDNFDADPSLIAGWYGAPLGGQATTGTATGLCMWVPAVETGATAPTAGAGWISPPNFATGLSPTDSGGFLPLVDQAVYRIRLTMWTDETATGAIPFWDLGYNNLNGTDNGGAVGNTYGGSYWALDVAGGSNGINDPTVNGRPNGRTTFDFWYAPNAFLAEQWRGVSTTLNGPYDDANNNAFATQFDSSNDMNLILRVQDSDQTANGIHNEVDTGTVCCKELRVDRADYNVLSPRISALYSHPISNTLFAVNPDAFPTLGGGGNGTGTISDVTNTATIVMGSNFVGSPGSATYNGGLKKLIFYDPTQISGSDFNAALNPVPWVSDQLLELAATVSSGVGGGTGTTEGVDPVDVIFIDFTTPTSEIGGFNYTQIGANGDMFRVASPRLKANTHGASQTYASFFYTQNTTSIDLTLPGFQFAQRTNGYIKFINNASLGGGSTNGKDAILIDSMVLNAVDITGFN